MIKSVMVVGGYGAVGRFISTELAAAAGLRLIVAGRRLELAADFAGEIGAEARHVDVALPETWAAAADGVDLVVMCVDQTDTRFVASLLTRGVAYVDITAGDAFFREVESLDARGAPALLSVGLAPGLTNLMAAHAAAELDRVERVEIGLLIGAGDRHGVAAIEWTAHQLFDRARPRGTFTVDFGEPWGARRVSRLGFSDQYALMRTLPIASVATGLCFDTRLLTSLVFAVGAAFAGNRLAKALATAVFNSIRVGSKTCNVSIAAHGWRGARPTSTQIRFHGSDQARTSARLARLTVTHLIEREVPPGVWHSHQILDAGETFREIERIGIGRIEHGSTHLRAAGP